jgi:hypothetical protein
MNAHTARQVAPKVDPYADQFLWTSTHMRERSFSDNRLAFGIARWSGGRWLSTESNRSLRGFGFMAQKALGVAPRHPLRALPFP